MESQGEPGREPRNLGHRRRWCVRDGKGLNNLRCWEPKFDEYRLFALCVAYDCQEFAFSRLEVPTLQRCFLDELMASGLTGLFWFVGKVPNCILDYRFRFLLVIDDIVDLVPWHGFEFRRKIRIVHIVQFHLMQGIGADFLVFFEAPGVIKFEIDHIIVVLDIEKEQLEAAAVLRTL